MFGRPGQNRECILGPALHYGRLRVRASFNHLSLQLTEGKSSFDIDLPTECDDEYWEHSDPAKSWQQPEGVPSKLSFFVAYIKQTQIIVGTHAFLVSVFDLAMYRKMG